MCSAIIFFSGLFSVYVSGACSVCAGAPINAWLCFFYLYIYVLGTFWCAPCRAPSGGMGVLLIRSDGMASFCMCNDSNVPQLCSVILCFIGTCVTVCMHE
jgi:hypothetical protein